MREHLRHVWQHLILEKKEVFRWNCLIFFIRVIIQSGTVDTFLMIPFDIIHPMCFATYGYLYFSHHIMKRTFSGVRVTRSLVLYVCFVERCLSFCTFSFGHCVVCSSSIYGI